MIPWTRYKKKESRLIPKFLIQGLRRMSPPLTNTGK